ncbi:uncharacterized protein LOC107743414 [Sinocyclocheilus rhinocerous]|uniref:uncharacterized protein LOC107743414 n=1 Tax=Sinocyclocheilus rhinocerous TaxID=307959 RepID=UPI0007B9BC09|nr:PREDICTED: uncharacterized protein LOC107743414 [Sinocyclocheilus rhinocerous]
MSCRTMISPRTVYFAYFALLFGKPPAKATNKNNTTPVKITENITMINDKNGTPPTSNINRQTTELNSAATTNKQSVSTQATTKPKEGHCIFFLPTGKDNLQLIVVALTVGCLALLLTTLICACQVCHLRGIISSLQHRYDNIDRHAVREKSESPCRDEGQVDGQPTETCLLLSEVTTAQEESREDEENKTEPCTEPPVKDTNGDVTQENSLEPDAKAPESSDTGV